jgi:hypothetical protein
VELKKYSIKVIDPKYWEEVHNFLCHESSCDYIPDRPVSCVDDKLHSPTTGIFELDDVEAEELRRHPHIEWVVLDIGTYPELYPVPSPATLKFSGDVKVYRDLGAANQPVSTGASIGEINRTNWAVIRTGITSSLSFWSESPLTGGTDDDEIEPVLGNASYSLTGKHVDVVIHDAGVFQYHPEFLTNGQSRVRDVVLDGPYYIDPDYFDNVIPGVKYTKEDGRVGIATTAAHEWWTTSSKRSVGFSTIGTVSISSGYTADRAMGTKLDGSAAQLTSGHGTACASLVAGKSFGLAFEADIWNMSGIGNPGTMGTNVAQNYDCMKLFHLYKPINPETGIKNPTLINGSWGYRAGFYSSSTNIGYRFQGTTGTYGATDATTDLPTAFKNGLLGGGGSLYKNWSSSSRDGTSENAGNELMDSGVIYVAAAGNNNQYVGTGSTDPNRLDYIQDLFFLSTDTYPEFSGITYATPTSHRDFMNPQGIGWKSSDPEFHPVINVGALDDTIIDNQNAFWPNGEQKAYYSNSGPGIDVYAPADETLAAGTNSATGYTDYQRADDTRFYDCYFNGTSAAAPVCSSVIAMYLSTNPTATQKEVKEWLFKDGSIVMNFDQFRDTYRDPTTTNYWSQQRNLRGGLRRIVYNPYANDVKPSFSNVNISGVTVRLR